MSVVVEKEGIETKRFDDVTTLSVDRGSITVATLFEGPTEIKDVAIQHIDFSSGRTVLRENG